MLWHKWHVFIVRARVVKIIFLSVSNIFCVLFSVYFFVVIAAGIQKWLCERVLKMSASPCSASVAQCTRFLYALLWWVCVFGLSVWKRHSSLSLSQFAPVAHSRDLFSLLVSKKVKIDSQFTPRAGLLLKNLLQTPAPLTHAKIHTHSKWHWLGILFLIFSPACILFWGGFRGRTVFFYFLFKEIIICELDYNF